MLDAYTKGQVINCILRFGNGKLMGYPDYAHFVWAPDRTVETEIAFFEARDHVTWRSLVRRGLVGIVEDQIYQMDADYEKRRLKREAKKATKK